jgi:hypothetical protein
VEYNNSAAGISLARKYVHAQPDAYDERASIPWDRIIRPVHIRGRDNLRFAPSLPLRALDSTAS